MSDSKSLKDLVLPGSHDAGMYETSGGVKTTGAGYVITQFERVSRQLELGTRFFDVRVYADDQKTLRVGHFQNKKKSTVVGIQMGSFGPPLIEVLGDIETFLSLHEGEVVLVKFSLADNAKTLGKAFIASVFGRDLLYEPGCSRNLAEVSISRLRGRLLPLFDKLESSDHPGFHLVSKDTPTRSDDHVMSRSTLWINGDAPMQGNVRDVVKKQVESRAKSATRGQLRPHLEMFYLTITATATNFFNGLCVADNTAREFKLVGVAQAKAVNRVCKFSRWEGDCTVGYKPHMANLGNPRPNIWQYDFINADMNNHILSLNEGLQLALEAVKICFRFSVAWRVERHDERDTSPAGGRSVGWRSSARPPPSRSMARSRKCSPTGTDPGACVVARPSPSAAPQQPRGGSAATKSPCSSRASPTGHRARRRTAHSPRRGPCSLQASAALPRPRLPRPRARTGGVESL
jgi:hypothetical protein